MLRVKELPKHKREAAQHERAALVALIVVIGSIVAIVTLVTWQVWVRCCGS